MALSAESKYPNRRAYVLKLSGEARPDTLAGRFENLVTGNRFEFASASELIESLVRDLRAAVGESSSDAPGIGGAHADRNTTHR